MTTHLRQHIITNFTIFLVILNVLASILFLLGQAYVNFHNVSSSYRKVTFSCLCAECDDIEWRRNNVPLSKSSYGVVGLEKEFWPNYTMTLKHSKLTTSNYDKALYSCHSVHFRDDALQIFPSYIESPCKNHFNSLY